MALIITTRSTDTDLTTTGQLKTLLGIASSATSEDARLAGLIRSASRWAETFIGYPLTVQSYREWRPSYSSRRLMVSRTPIRGIKQLLDSASTEDGVEILSSEFFVDDEAGFLLRDEGWEWTAPLEQDLSAIPRAGQEYEPWLIDYVAGWTYSGIDPASENYSTEAGTTSTGRTLPEDIETAVLQRCMHMYDGDMTGPTASESLGDVSVSYMPRTGKRAFVDSFEILLENYRRVV